MIESDARLALYRMAGALLQGFFSRWTGRYCCDCLQLTHEEFPDDPKCDSALIDGLFPGCCQQGVADTFRLAGRPGAGPVCDDLAGMVKEARVREGIALGDPPGYTVREKGSGKFFDGKGCGYLGPDGCRAGELKAPLCFAYVCNMVVDRLAERVEVCGKRNPFRGWEEDNFLGAASVFASINSNTLETAKREVDGLAQRLGECERALTDGLTSTR